jgi:Mn-dependent DtxR family transcriptional regulator
MGRFYWDAAEGLHRDRRRRMEKEVRDAMKKAGKPVRPGDVAKMLKADSKEVTKIINELKKQGKVSSPKRCFYEPA